MSSMEEVTAALAPGFNRLGFKSYTNGWFLYRRPDGSDFAIKFCKAGKPTGTLSEVYLRFDLIDWRQVELLTQWMAPANLLMLERSKERPYKSSIPSDWLGRPDVLTWFEPRLSREKQRNHFVHRMYFLTVQQDDLKAGHFGKLPKEAEDKILRENFTVWRHTAWRIPNRMYVSDDDPQIERDRTKFDRTIETICTFAKDILLPFGLTLSLADLLDKDGFLAKRRWQNPYSPKRWGLALDLAAAVVVGKKFAIREVFGERAVKLGVDPTDLDVDAFDLITRNARAADTDGWSD